MRSYNSLNSRILNTSLKNSNILVNALQTNYLGNTSLSNSNSSNNSNNSNSNADLTNYALKTYVDASLNNYTYTKSYIDSGLNNLNIQINGLINSAPGTLDTLGEIANAINGEANFGIVVYQKIASSDLSINNLRISNGIQDTSINSAIVRNGIQDTSINSLTTSINTIITTNGIQDTSINSLTTSINLLSSSTNNLIQDTSINSAIVRNGIQDTSINSLTTSINTINTTNGIQDISINSAIVRNGVQDTSINFAIIRNGVQDTSINLLTSIYTSDISLNGNVQLGSGVKSISINKAVDSGFSLDISGATRIVGNLSVIKNPSDASYSFLDLSSSNLSVFNMIEKFSTLTFNTTSMTLNYSQGSLFYTTATANFAGLTITNVPTTLNRSISITLLTSQSGTFYFTGTSITINGTSISYIKQDGTAFSAPSSSRTMMIYQFNIIYASSTPIVIGYISGYS
jgi:hypothetical protein